MTSIADIIARIESHGDTHALRFEPLVYARASSVPPASRPTLERIAKLHKCSVATAAMLYSTSWGTRQIMGFNIWGPEQYGGTLYDFLADDEAQIRVFYAFLRRVDLQDITPEQLAKSQQARLKFSMAYNGSIAYEQPMLEALRFYGFSPN